MVLLRGKEKRKEWPLSWNLVTPGWVPTEKEKAHGSQDTARGEVPAA